MSDTLAEQYRILEEQGRRPLSEVTRAKLRLLELGAASDEPSRALQAGDFVRRHPLEVGAAAVIVGVFLARSRGARSFLKMTAARTTGGLLKDVLGTFV